MTVVEPGDAFGGPWPDAETDGCRTDEIVGYHRILKIVNWSETLSMKKNIFVLLLVVW